MESERSAPSQINELDARTMPRVWPISGGTLFRHQIVVTLASLYPLSSWSGGRRSVDTLVPEQCPGDTGCLIGHGDQHHVCRPPRQEPVGPARPRARLGAAPAQHGSRTMHEQAPDIAIPALRYPSQSRVIMSWVIVVLLRVRLVRTSPTLNRNRDGLRCG